MAESKVRTTSAPRSAYGDELKIEDWMPIRQTQVRTGAPGNPFLPEPQPALSARPVLDQVRGPTQKPVDTIARRQGLIGPGQSLGDGYRLTPQEHLMLAQAPKKPPGTEVTVRAYDIPRRRGWLGQHTPDHMYVEYDDGREQLLARGGPSDGLLGSALSDDATVTAQVRPAHLSPDYGRGERVMYRGFLPGVQAQEAADPARRRAQSLAGEGRRYTGMTNSNSYAADVTEDQFGVRPGDRQTWGYRNRLDEAPRVHPLDLSPALTYLAY